jgi:predicted  nucleic acid-binding Zn-ribbon protein
MKITVSQLRQIIKEEIRKVSINEESTALKKRLDNLQDRIAKLKKKLSDTKSPVQKAEVQGRLSRALQSLSNLRKEMQPKKK